MEATHIFLIAFLVYFISQIVDYIMNKRLNKIKQRIAETENKYIKVNVISRIDFIEKYLQKGDDLNLYYNNENDPIVRISMIEKNQLTIMFNPKKYDNGIRH